MRLNNNFNEPYSSTLSYESLRIILGEAIINDFRLEFMDVSNAYAYAEIDTDIYIQLPSGTTFLDVTNYNGRIIYGDKLLKSLYILK